MAESSNPANAQAKDSPQIGLEEQVLEPSSEWAEVPSPQRTKPFNKLIERLYSEQNRGGGI
jgi:hypothetical protein